MVQARVVEFGAARLARAAVGLVVCVGAACSVLLVAGPAEAALPTLTFTYSANALQATLGNGSVVGPSTAIPAGTYEVIIDNPQYVDPNPTFLLTGPGVDLQTDIGGYALTSESDDETFAPNSTYSFQDIFEPETQSSFMTSSASAGAAPTTPTTPSTSSTVGVQQNTQTLATQTNSSSLTAKTPLPSTVYLGVLDASVSAAGKLALSYKGRGVSSLSAGTYTISTVDRSKTAGFVIQQVSKPALTVTGAAFTGTRATKVTLTVGQWVFYPSILGKKSYFIVTR